MVDKDFERSVELWINDNPRLFRRAARWTMASYHHRLPRAFRPTAIAHFSTKSALACSAPTLAYLVYDTITAWMATVASCAIFFGHTLVAFFDRLSREGHSSQKVDQTEFIVRVGELIRMCAPASRAQANRDDMIRSSLGIIENFARQITKSKKNEISVSIALYEGNSGSKMRIRHRNPGNARPIGKVFDGRGVLGHHACLSGTGPKIVHNLSRMHRKFRRSPTDSEVVYRSFLILPLTVARNGSSKIGGFLSIDSTRPYTFYGSRGRVLVVNCEPLVEHIQQLL